MAVYKKTYPSMTSCIIQEIGENSEHPPTKHPPDFDIDTVVSTTPRSNLFRRGIIKVMNG